MKFVIPSLVVLVILLTGAVAYLAGTQNLSFTSFLKPSSSPSDITSPPPKACTLDGKVCEDGSTVGRTGPNCEFAPCPSAKPTQTVKGGGILSFPKYELTLPADWTWAREVQGADNEKITLAKGEYGIAIAQGGFGGAMCLYPGDAEFEGPAGRYTTYVEITTKSGDKLRRSTPETGKGFGLCHLTAYGWGTPTLYGHIGLTTPSNPSAAMLKELDTVIASITKL
jgi:hypothetical protein